MRRKTRNNKLLSDVSFSPRLAFFRVMRKVSTICRLEKASLYWNRLISEYAYRYVEKIAKPVAKQYQGHVSPGEKPLCGNIWTCWWQGIENAPLMVQNCVRSMEEHSGKHKVVIITKDNYKDYVQVPDFIMEQVLDGRIPYVKLSNYLRMCLLEKYGGLWLDSTIFCSEDIPDEWFDLPWYTAKSPYNGKAHAPGKGLWVCNQIGGWKGNSLFSYMRKSLEAYWSKTSKSVDYFFLDYILICGMNTLPELKQMQEDVPENCVHRDSLKDAMMKGMPASEWGNVIYEDTCAYKLNWKLDYETEAGGSETIYAFFLRRGYDG